MLLGLNDDSAPYETKIVVSFSLLTSNENKCSLNTVVLICEH